MDYDSIIENKNCMVINCIVITESTCGHTLCSVSVSEYEELILVLSVVLWHTLVSFIV